MNKEIIIRKLTSRKFWAAVVGFVTQIMLAYGCQEGTIAQTAACIMAGATLIAYIVAEGLVDGSGNNTPDNGITIFDEEQ